MKILGKTGEVDFDKTKVASAISRAFVASNNILDSEILEDLTNQVTIKLKNTGKKIFEKDEVLDAIEDILMFNRFFETARTFIRYRYQHILQKDIGSPVFIKKMFNKYIDKTDWKIKENSNMGYSLQGLNNYIISEMTSSFWLDYVYPESAKVSHKDGYIHIHDLGLLSVYCVGWDMRDLLVKGFGGVPGKVTSKPAKHFSTALGQIVNFFYTLQGESAGAQALSNFDTYLAPFIRYDGLTYKQVRQELQSFVFNINVPTRVGFQCVSEDTEVLTVTGWKKYHELSIGENIYTLNIHTQTLETCSIQKINVYYYSGVMFQIKNTIQDQLVTPNHKVVLKESNKKYILKEASEISSISSPFMIPIASDNIRTSGINLTLNEIKFLACICASDFYDEETSSFFITVKNNYNLIKKILSDLHISYKVKNKLSKKTFIINDERSLKLLGKLFPKGYKKEIPSQFLNMNKKQARVFLDTFYYIKNIQHYEMLCENETLSNQLQMLCVLAGYGSILKKTSSKNKYTIKPIVYTDSIVSKLKSVKYTGKVWCPTTINNTFVARRNGKVFITGNSPFTNVTLDLTVPKHLKDEPVIIGGNLQKDCYGNYQEEVDLFNKALFEVLLEGDSHGRVFTFPIPTVNITKNFDWDNKKLDSFWEATSKYGIPYFANFISSSMSPSDTRSMCCRLRLNLKELFSKGGGLFGANSLTGSIGVVTINLPILAYEANGSLDKFYTKIVEYMDIAKDALEAKRKVLEDLTNSGLYPYIKYYLEAIKQRDGKFWSNHFSTIGLIGMAEAAANLGIKYNSPEGKKFGESVLTLMRNKLLVYQKETKNFYNLEATPAEGASYKLALLTKKKYPKIITSGNNEPYFTNSSQLPVGATDDIFEVLEHQKEMQSLYTGGTVLHIFLGERIQPKQAKALVKKIFENYTLPYISITPTFSICPVHGYISGEHKLCPVCLGEKKEIEDKLTQLTKNSS